MKIAVLTWFRDSNFGTILQAYSLQMFLKKYGHEAYLINYIPPRIPTQHKKLSFAERLSRKYNYLSEKHYVKKNREGFLLKKEAAFKTIDNSCSITSEVVSKEDFIKLNEYFDAFICGSDQVWNPFWLDGRFFLDFVQVGNLKIAYAPSMGVSSISESVGKQIGEFLKDFSYISVREKRAVDLLKPYVDREMSVVCDPVFLLSKESWEKFAESEDRKINEKYVFYYFLSYQPEHWRAAVRFAKSKKLKLVGIPVYGRQYCLNNCIKFPFASPELFVKLINEAEYVLTDSFHATVFSIILEKQFYTFARFRSDNNYSQNSRVENILNQMDLEDRIVQFRNSRINDLSDTNYAGDIAKKKQDYIRKSADFLLNALKEAD